MDELIAAIDLGTSGTRCLIMDSNKNIVSYAYRPNNIVYPQAGWSEIDATQILLNTYSVVKEALRKGKIEPNSVSAIGIANQRETTVIWNKRTGKPVYNAILWQDVRTEYICGKHKDKSEWIFQKTGLTLSPYFSASKIAWILENVPQAKMHITSSNLLFGTMDSWLIWNLTGGKKHTRPLHVTDHTNASRTMLMNIRSLEWCEDIMQLFGIPDSMLPEIVPSSSYGPLGYTSQDSIFQRQIPITACLGDQQASLFGELCVNIGDTKCTYGTGSFILQNIGPKPLLSKNKLITTVAFSGLKIGLKYAIEGSIPSSGIVLNWLQKNLNIRMETNTNSKLDVVPEASLQGLYFVPAFSGLFAPYWDSRARGLIIGLTHYTTARHILSAALEATCYQTRDVLDVMQKDTGMEIRELMVDGGMTENENFLHLLADLLGRNIIKAKRTEMTAVGAAYMAGLASDLWMTLSDLIDTKESGKFFEPRLTGKERDSLYKGWKRAIERCKRWT
ncbi:MAG: glycerol kinase GlpK [Nitrososphaerota archaeon]